MQNQPVPLDLLRRMNERSRQNRPVPTPPPFPPHELEKATDLIQSGMSREDALRRGMPIALFDFVTSAMGAAGESMGQVQSPGGGKPGLHPTSMGLHGTLGAGVGGAAGIMPPMAGREPAPGLNEQRREQDKLDHEYELEQWRKHGNTVTPTPPPRPQFKRTREPEPPRY